MDWIFSHLDDLESMDVSEGGRSEGGSEASREPPPGPRVRDGAGSKCVCVAFYNFFFLNIMISSNDSNLSHPFVLKSMSFLRSSVTWDRAQCVVIMSATSRRTNSE